MDGVWWDVIRTLEGRWKVTIYWRGNVYHSDQTWQYVGEACQWATQSFGLDPENTYH